MKTKDGFCAKRALSAVSFAALTFFIFFFLCAVPSLAAEGTEDLTDDISFSDIGSALPDEVRELLPEDIFSSSGTDAAEAVTEALDYENFFLWFANSLSAALPGTLSRLSSVLGIVVLAAVFGALREAVAEKGGSPALSGAVRLASSLCLILVLFRGEEALFGSVYECLGRLTGVMDAFVPVMGAVYAAGGSVGAAAAQSTSMLFLLAVCENACMYVLFPMLKICFGLTLAAAVAGGIRIEGIAKTVRGMYTGILGLFMVVLISVMASKSMIAAGADTLATRTAKLVFGNMIPVIGGAVSDSVGALAAGLSVIKSGTGALGVLLVLLLTLPMILSLLLDRVALSLCAGAAGILGCENERRTIEEVGELSGFALALTAMCAMLFIFASVIFVSSNLAIGGAA